MLLQLGEDILATYEPYSNPYAQWSVKILSNTKFEVYSRYQIIGLRAFHFYHSWERSHRLSRCRDKGIGTPNHEFVAIKKIETNRFDCKLFAKGIIRELKLLRLLKH